MPLTVDPRQGTDWRATLNAALEKLNALDAEAKKFRAETNRYIRPITLVQVERTGADQRESGHVHAVDVKDWLLTAGFDEAEIAIKTAEQNDLNQPENQDLLSRSNRVRAIITKQALQEGWDCPFAYVLCALAASTNPQALTQLVGRILRQPGAMRTSREALDECHVVTHHAETRSAMEAIKDGLEQDGLSDLVVEVSQEGNGGAGTETRRIDRHPTFASTEIYLPKVMTVNGREVRELDYETDVLSRIDWRGFDPKDIADRIPENAQAAESQLQRIRLAEDGEEFLVEEGVAQSDEILAFDPVHAVRMIVDIVPNPFVGQEIVSRVIDRLVRRGFDETKLGQLSGLIVEVLRAELEKERNARAEVIFRREVEASTIQFRLRLDGRDWKMPFHIETTEPEKARQLLNESGGPLQKSLFAPVYENEFNRDERDVAVYLDAEEALSWWHRNVARRQYGIQGWKKGKIYPDFIFAVETQGSAGRITVLETKGDHLDNLDTEYKRSLLSFLSDNFAWEDSIPVGQLELVKKNGRSVQCALILISEWKTKLPALLGRD